MTIRKVKDRVGNLLWIQIDLNKKISMQIQMLEYMRNNNLILREELLILQKMKNLWVLYFQVQFINSSKIIINSNLE